MKAGKIIIYILGGLFLILGIAIFFGSRYFNNIWFKERPLYLSFTPDFSPIQFDWSESTYGSYTEVNDAIQIPLEIEGIPLKMYLQLDTGAPTSMLYGNTLASLSELGLKLPEVVVDETRFVQEMSFRLGGSQIEAKMLKIYDGYGSEYDPTDSLEVVRLGTLGADFFVPFIAEVDFKNGHIQLYKEREPWMSADHPFQSFGFEGRRFMLPAVIDGKKRDLFYDSGSSAFGLITTRNRYRRHSSKEVEEIKYDANSWGNSMPITHNATDVTIDIGGLSLPLVRVSYVDMYAGIQRFMIPITPIGGWLGNKPFVESSLIFDCERQEFVVLQKD